MHPEALSWIFTHMRVTPPGVPVSSGTALTPPAVGAVSPLPS